MSNDAWVARGARAALICLGLGAALLTTRPAAAWDPSTTHQGVLESAVTRSALHLRWMDASELERGVFSSLRVVPANLDPDELRLLKLTIHGAHADGGALPLGGPGACPPADAPPETQQFCVDRDLWEHSALGWLRLGIIAEVTPSTRHLHHFVDLEQPGEPRWRDDELPASLLRTRQARSNGEPLAGVVTGSNFSGQADSAVAWLADPSDLLAPARTYAHLELASTAATQVERDHHLALGLLGVGALIHVIQDLSVPAHARGDATAFFAPLSPAPGDRGLPLQEFVRVEYGRHDLPGLSPATAPPSGIPLAETLLGHVLGDGAGYEGIATLAGRHFLSESSVPAPAYLDDALSPRAAAAALLGDDHGLAAVEVESAQLSPWPASRGYLLSSTGRPLAAFDTDREGRVRPYLDEACYRDQATLLIPAATDVTRSILDLLWPAWPEMQRSGDSLTLTIPDWASATLDVMIETDDGERRSSARHTLTVSSDNHVEFGDGELDAGERIVMVLSATRQAGPPIVIEQRLTADAAPTPTLGGPEQPEAGAEAEAPEAEAPEAPSEPDGTDTDATDTDAADTDATDTDATDPDADATDPSAEPEP